MAGLFWKVRALKEQGRQREAFSNALRDTRDPDTPYVDEAGEAMGVGTPEGLTASYGGPNIQNALNQMYAGPGDQPVQAFNIQRQLAKERDRGTTANKLPSAIQVYEYWKSLPTEEARQDMINTMRQNFDMQKIGGVPTLIEKGPRPQTTPLSTLSQEIEGQSGIAGGKTAAQELERFEAKKRAAKPKAKMQAIAAREKGGFVTSTIDKAISEVSALTAGPGAMTRAVPGTPAKDLSETLATIKANIGFDRLQEMRASSPTGGALGQVSEMENKLLQAVWGSLDQSQSPEQLKENLIKAKQAVIASWQRIAQAYEQDYGEPMPTEGTPLEGVTSNIDDLVNKYAD